MLQKLSTSSISPLIVGRKGRSWAWPILGSKSLKLGAPLHGTAPPWQAHIANMAPWDFITRTAPDPALPDTLAASHTGTDTAFEVFVDGALTKIYNEASGRSKEQKQIREACKKVLGRSSNLCLMAASVGRAT